MSSIRPLSRREHATKRWRAPSNQMFAATTAVAPLAAAEVAQAALALPLSFMERTGGWSLVAVLGLAPDQNLYVNAAGGWSTSYIPAAFRAYPFCLGQDAAAETVLCVDESSGLVTDGPQGEAFFDEAGEPSAATKRVHAFLSETARSETILIKACGALRAAGVIEPWPVIIQEDGVERRQVAGLHRINEAALNALDDATFGHLRRTGAAGVAYAQLLSMGNLVALSQRAQERAKAEAAARARAEIKPLIVLPEDSSIDWDWSKIGQK